GADDLGRAAARAPGDCERGGRPRERWPRAQRPTAADRLTTASVPADRRRCGTDDLGHAGGPSAWLTANAAGDPRPCGRRARRAPRALCRAPRARAAPAPRPPPPPFTSRPRARGPPAAVAERLPGRPRACRPTTAAAEPTTSGALRPERLATASVAVDLGRAG